MQNANFGNVRVHRRSTTDDLLFDIWSTRWLACSKQDTIVIAQSQMQSLMKLQRLQFCTWLHQRSAQQQKQRKQTSFISHCTVHMWLIIWKEDLAFEIRYCCLALRFSTTSPHHFARGLQRDIRWFGGQDIQHWFCFIPRDTQSEIWLRHGDLVSNEQRGVCRHH